MNNRIKTTITILTVFILSVLSSILFLSFKYKDSCKVDLNIDKNKDKTTGPLTKQEYKLMCNSLHISLSLDK